MNETKFLWHISFLCLFRPREAQEREDKNRNSQPTPEASPQSSKDAHFKALSEKVAEQDANRQQAYKDFAKGHEERMKNPAERGDIGRSE